ncbi:hypothetical protein [Bradyrhizobium sp. AZCC 2289]|uniref:hypothetical protein n=1 Tax=Bradyrhizobium sp. AZCC 2289 TaxID=3117026 RepID=UPI002FF02A47
MLGEHGESAIIHWSGATVSGMPLETFLSRTGKELSGASRDLVLRSVHEAAKAIKEGKGATHYGIASAIARGAVAAVTGKHYDQDPRIGEKREALQKLADEIWRIVAEPAAAQEELRRAA